MRHRAGLVLRGSRASDALELTKMFHQVNFAALLGVKDAELVQYDSGRGIVTHHTVTPYYCRTDPGPHRSSPPYLSAGVLTALFDEMSTCAAIVQDRSHRPGVSVTLEVQVLKQDIGPGSVLKLTTWADRVGKTLAFLSMKMHDTHTGELVAVGRHVKYLPLGLAWDAAMAPSLYPLARTLIHSSAQKIANKGQRVVVGPSLYSAFECSQQRPEEGMRGQDSSSYSFTVESKHSNGFGKMHGGALAVLAEDVAIKHWYQQQQQQGGGKEEEAASSSPRARHMSVNYYSALSKGDIRVSPTILQQQQGAAGSTQGGEGISVVDVLQSGKLSNKATLIWA